MLPKKFKDETKDTGSACKITIEEIRQFNAFKDTDEKTLMELSEFIYQLSLILFKANNNEKT